MSQIYGTGKSNIKGIIAGILLIGGFLIAAFANQWAVRQHLVGFTAQKWPERQYHRVWFSQDGSMVGAVADGTKLMVERYDRSGNDSHKWTVDVGQSIGSADEQTEWMVDREAQRLAYASPHGLVVRPLCEPGSSGCAGQQFTLPAASRSILAFSFVPGRMLAAAFNDSTVLLWDTETGNQVGRLTLSLESPDQARWNTDYLAVVSSSLRTTKVFRLASGPALNVVEESKTPSPPFRLMTPGTGQVGYASAGGFWYRGGTRNSPGAVRAAVLGGNDMLVGAGEFNGLQVLTEKEDPYPLLEGETDQVSASVLAAGSSRFAYSGQAGTGLVGLTTETRVTPTGRHYNFIGLAIAVVGGLLAASSLLFDFVGMSFRAQGVGKKSRKTLLDPDPDLISAFLDGKTVLWAGAGLSAQAGFPTRQTFLNQTLQTADGEVWLEPAKLMKLYERVQQGLQEEVLDEIIETLHYQRVIMVAHFKVVYCRFTPLSACHKIIKRLPAAAAITTNYDGCLEMIGSMWSHNVLSLKQGGHRGAAEKDQFFLLRLYGDPRFPADVKLSHKEFAESLKSDPTLADTMQLLFSKKTMFFVGCSVEGLVADLKLIPKLKKSEHKHYAVAGVGYGAWHKHVQTLEQQYGIHCVVCSDETIATELPKFLDNLATQIEEAQADKTKRGKDMIAQAVKKSAAGGA